MVSNLRRFFYHPQKSQVLRHTLSSFDFGENVMPNQHSNIHILGIYLQAYFIIVQCLPSVSSPCLDDKGSLWTLSTSAIALLRCFSANFKVGSSESDISQVFQYQYPRHKMTPLSVWNVATTLGRVVNGCSYDSMRMPGISSGQKLSCQKPNQLSFSNESAQ